MQVTIDSLEFSSYIRCYDGAFDSKTQRVLDERNRVLQLIKVREPNARVTYFPVEEEYVVHSYGRELSGYRSSAGLALYDAYIKLYGG